VVADGAREFLDGVNAGAQGLGAPLMEEFTRPGRGVVIPELLELFLQQVRTHALQVVAQQVAQPEPLLVGQVLGALEQAPARFLERRFVALACHAPRFLGPHVVERQVHLRHHVEAVQNTERVGAVLGNQVQIGLPHVRADELDLGRQFLAEHDEELLEALARALPADPQQAGAAGFDLIDQRQVVVAAAVGNFIDADRFDRIELPVLKPPLHDVLDGVANLLPAGAKAHCSLLPRQLARPVGQMQHVGAGQGVLTGGPGHLLDFDAAGVALHAPHAVQQFDCKAPHRDELEAALRQLIVAPRGLRAARAAGRGTDPRPYLDLNRFARLDQTRTGVDKSWKMIAG